MRVAPSIAAALFVATAALTSASAAESAFDGNWEVTLNCPPHHEDDDAKGYTHRFPATVQDGYFKGTHGIEGQPSWRFLTGNIEPNGTATLNLDGIVNNPNYAVNNAFRGKPYSYRVRAKFDQSAGTGQRIGKRKCGFEFKRL